MYCKSLLSDIRRFQTSVSLVRSVRSEAKSARFVELFVKCFSDVLPSLLASLKRSLCSALSSVDPLSSSHSLTLAVTAMPSRTLVRLISSTSFKALKIRAQLRRQMSF